MADETKDNTPQEPSPEDQAKEAKAAQKAEDKAQAERESNMTDAQEEELAASRGETRNRDLSDHETALTVEEANEVGFLGTKVDPLPNRAYAVEGVTGGTANAKATPKSKGGSGR